METPDKRTELTRLFFEISKIIKSAIAKGCEDMGFTLPQTMVITALIRHGGLRISDLSEQLNMTNSTVSGIVDRLEAQGVLERSRSEKDRRVIFINLSVQFRANHKTFHENADKFMQKLLQSGTDEDIDKITEGLNTFKKIIENRS